MSWVRRIAGAAIIVAAIAGCGVGGGRESSATDVVTTSPPPKGSSASCTVRPGEASAHAKTILIGTMLGGQTAGTGTARVLVTPAKVRVTKYVRGGGPDVVRVDTGVSLDSGVARVEEDGIMPAPGQRWMIVSDSKHPPLTTSVCAGSRQLKGS